MYISIILINLRKNYWVFKIFTFYYDLIQFKSNYIYFIFDKYYFLIFIKITISKMNNVFYTNLFMKNFHIIHIQLCSPWNYLNFNPLTI